MACWAKRLTSTAAIGTRKNGASAASASTRIGAGEARAARPEDAARQPVGLGDEDHQHRGGPVERQRADGADDREQREIGRRRGDVGGARDVALAPRLGQLLRRRVEDLLAARSPRSSRQRQRVGQRRRRAAPPQKCRMTGAASIRIRRPAGGDRRRADEGDHELRHGAVDGAERQVVGEGRDHEGRRQREAEREGLRHPRGAPGRDVGGRASAGPWAGSRRTAPWPPPP